MSADANPAPADIIMECRVCWQVYDPGAGDPRGQVAPGTAFRDLPADWRCPQCDAPAALYLPVT